MKTSRTAWWLAFGLPVLGCHHASTDADGGTASDAGAVTTAATTATDAGAAITSAPKVREDAGAPSGPALALVPLTDAGPLPPNLGLAADGTLKPGFRKPKLESSDLATIFAKVPELQRFAADVKLYDPGDVNGIRSRSSASVESTSFTTQPMLWVPETETELLVVLAHTKTTGIVAALYPLPNNEYRLASSFLLQNDLAPIALAFDPHNRKELIWTACWGCAGEQGHVSVRDDHRVVIVQD